jgi:TPP-dependent pyruvate/acetoin dehydrogenase alpha subunit
VAITGEGAANQGAFHESLNLAALWQLPVVFVVDDNDWAISVPRSASSAIPSAGRAAAHGIPGTRIEDNDVEAVYTAAREAVAGARAGEGPYLLEVHTLRMLGHSRAMPSTTGPTWPRSPTGIPSRRTPGGWLPTGSSPKTRSSRSSRSR